MSKISSGLRNSTASYKNDFTLSSINETKNCRIYSRHKRNSCDKKKEFSVNNEIMNKSLKGNKYYSKTIKTQNFDPLVIESYKNTIGKRQIYLRPLLNQKPMKGKTKLRIGEFHQSRSSTKESVNDQNPNKLKARISELENKLESFKKEIFSLKYLDKLSQQEINQHKIEKKENLSRCLFLTEEISYLQIFKNGLEQSNKGPELSTKSQLNEKLQPSNQETSQNFFDIEKKMKECKETEEKAKIILDENIKIKHDIEIYMRNNASLSKHLNESSIKLKDLENLNQEKEKQIEILNNQIAALKREIDNLKKHLKSNIQEELQNIRSIVVDANKYSRSCSQKFIQIDQYKFDEKYGGIKENYDSLQQEIHELLLEDQSRLIRPSN